MDKTTRPDISKKDRIKQLAAWIMKMEETGQDKKKPALYLDLLTRLKSLSIDKSRRQ